MKNLLLALCLVFIISTVSAEVFFKEEFNDGEGWKSRWVISKHTKEGTAGEFVISAGKYSLNEEADKGLKLSQDAKFYVASAEFNKEFSNRDRDLVIQYSVKHEQNLDCGGGYIKVFPSSLKQDDLHSESDYNLMFGPDICGATKKVHVILNYKDKNRLVKKDIKAESDEYSHVYTLILRQNKTYEVLIDNKEVQRGSLLGDWDFLPPKEIFDPAVKKPADWVDDKQMPDPSAVKPEDYDSIPRQIADKDSFKPNDWDNDLDGEWEPPMIENPAYRGEWKAPMIDNPNFKGEWVHPKIANPDFKEDPNIGVYDHLKYVAVEVWQVKSGSIFDNFLVTDEIETAHQLAEKTVKLRDAEKEARKKIDGERHAGRPHRPPHGMDFDAPEDVGGEEDMDEDSELPPFDMDAGGADDHDGHGHAHKGAAHDEL